MKTAFITGCASGFGHRLARALIELDHHVIASDVNAERLWSSFADVKENPRLQLLHLDVRDEEQVRQVTSRIQDVDLLVNNAGIAIFGSQEETDLTAIRDLFDVNVFGPIRVTKALLPSLRRRKGTIVQLSSVAGRTVFPESGFYAATKYAIEAMSEALFQETCTFGVRIRLIEPGSFATRFLEHAEEASPPRIEDSEYAHVRELWDERKTEVLEQPQNPDLVVHAIIKSLDDPRPWLRVPVGADAIRILELRDALGPDAWSHFAAERNGLESDASPEIAILKPEEIVTMWGQRGKEDQWSDAEAGQLRATVLAAQLKHLDHWNTERSGQAALALLAPLMNH